jgi:phosphoserine phosphatase
MLEPGGLNFEVEGAVTHSILLWLVLALLLGALLGAERQYRLQRGLSRWSRWRRRITVFLQGLDKHSRTITASASI